MARKEQVLSELLASTTQEIVANPGSYTAFLQTAAQNYKYRFQDQVLIHAQRPNAKACAEIGIWNRLGRWVNRGAKGIALLQDGTTPYRIRYVFDVADTNSREGRSISLWQMKPEYENDVINNLQDRFLLNWDGSFRNVVDMLSQQLAEETHAEQLPDLLENKAGSFLEELDDGSIARWFQEAGSESVSYMVLYRCGYQVRSDDIEFGRVLDFNTVSTASILGNAVSTLSGHILREIGVTVKALERQKIRTFDSFGGIAYNEAGKKESERSQDHESDIHDAGRLSDSRPDPPGESEGGQVWMLRLSYLRKHRVGLYNGMLMSGTLNRHLEETDREANRMLEQLTRQMAQTLGVTEELKAQNQLQWVGLMNNVRQTAEEQILQSLIYA